MSFGNKSQTFAVQKTVETFPHPRGEYFVKKVSNFFLLLQLITIVQCNYNDLILIFEEQSMDNGQQFHMKYQTVKASLSSTRKNATDS